MSLGLTCVSYTNLVVEDYAENLRKHNIQKVHSTAVLLEEYNDVVIIVYKALENISLSIYQLADVAVRVYR